MRVPGKLMVAGEYAVLEPGQQAVVMAVDRYVTASCVVGGENRLSLPDMGLLNLRWEFRGGQVYFDHDDLRLRFVGLAMAVALQFSTEQRRPVVPFSISVHSELADADGRKYGLGSSAAVVTAVVGAITRLLSGDPASPAPGLLFKLAAIAHFRAQGSGSGADVAASTFGGWLRYVAFRPDWLAESLAAGGSLSQLVTEPWPYLAVQPLAPPAGLRLCVGWTGEPASTGPLIKRVLLLRQNNPVSYYRFLRESAAAVGELVHGVEDGDRFRIIRALAQNRDALVRLGIDAQVPIETPALAELHRLAGVYGGAGKPSGAGGGDCGIALIPAEVPPENLANAWRQSGIEPLPLQVATAGAEVKS